tara:strand:- start:235 stop:1080 length:846 start_codon:yes stop_codon:yes gene_type:complete
MLVQDIFKQLDREWVLELFTKAQNEKWTLLKLCLEYFSITQDKEFKIYLESCIIDDKKTRKSNTGITGDLVEWMITGDRKTSSEKPDLLDYGLDIDVKCLSFFEGILTEKLSLTSVSWEGKKALRYTKFEDSNIFSKKKLLVPKFSEELNGTHKVTKNGNLSKVKGKTVYHMNRIFIGFQYVDLNILLDRAKQDYIYYQNTVIEKGEHYVCYKLGSGQYRFDSLGNIQFQRNPVDRSQVLHKKQAGNGKKQAKDRIIEGKIQKTYPQKWNIGVEVMMNYFF